MPYRELDSYHGPATITIDDGDRFNVECSYVVSQEMVRAREELLPGLKGWNGTFTTEAVLAGAVEGTLQLPDGRSGRILVTRFSMGPGGHGEFTGNGAPPA